MSAPDRVRDIDRACRALDEALRARLCVTSVRIRLYTPDRDLEYARESSRVDGAAHGASVRMMIRDARGIVGEIDIVDGCHRTCTGRAIHEMARIVEAHAAAIRQSLAAGAIARPAAV